METGKGNARQETRKETSEIRIPQGMLRGNDFGKYREYLNVPYASDRGRFRAAGEAPCWDGVRDATVPGPVFPQMRTQPL